MAQILVTYDTKEKTLTVSQDGNILDNIENVNFCKCYDEDDVYSMNIATHYKDEASDIKTAYYMYAKKIAEQKVPEKVLVYLNSFNQNK